MSSIALRRAAVKFELHAGELVAGAKKSASAPLMSANMCLHADKHVGTLGLELQGLTLNQTVERIARTVDSKIGLRIIRKGRNEPIERLAIADRRRPRSRRCASRWRP